LRGTKSRLLAAVWLMLKKWASLDLWALKTPCILKYGSELSSLVVWMK
jgi:hypothetical protein